MRTNRANRKTFEMINVRDKIRSSVHMFRLRFVFFYLISLAINLDSIFPYVYFRILGICCNGAEYFLREDYIGILADLFSKIS